MNLKATSPVARHGRRQAALVLHRSRWVHDRMPVLLAERDFEPWLNGEAGVELLKPAPNDLL
jgi:hypothetical protein